MALITIGDAHITPTIVLTHEAARAAQTIIHPILGRENPDATLRPALLRSGRLELGFQGPGSEDDSHDAVTALASGEVAILTHEGRDTLGMTFVVIGDIPRAIEDVSRDAWIVGCGFQEIQL